MKKFLLFLPLIFCIYSCTAKSEAIPLENLQKMTAQEQLSKPIQLNARIPSYRENGSLIDKKDWGDFMSNKAYEKDLYTDTSGNVKAIVFKLGKENKTPPAKADLKADQWVGKEAVDFEALDLQGNKVRLSQFKGKVVVLNYWFIDCRPCILEMDDLNALKKKYKDKVIFLGITFDRARPVKDFLKQTSFDYTILPDAEAICKKWDIQAYPTNVVIGKQGIVNFIKIGFDRNIQIILDEAIQSAQ